MNGDGAKKTTVLNKPKQVAGTPTSPVSATANGVGKKRRKDLKPIITGDGQQSGSAQGSATRCVRSLLYM